MYCIRDTIIELLKTFPFTDVNILLAIILALIVNIAIYLIYVKIVIPKLKTSFENNSKNNI